MSEVNGRLSLQEKVGYSLGDAAANFVWRSTMFLPIFYTDTFGLAAAQVAVLLLLVRLSDGVTDIIMGSIADRTDSKKGKFRPWILWSAPVLATFLALLFSTPDLGETGKLIYAYIIYFGLTLAYTANNVPYGALMGVMTPSVNERASLSAFRFAGAFGGGFLVMTFTPELVAFFGQGDKAVGYQYTMLVFAALLVVFFIITYKTTQERVTPPPISGKSFAAEMGDLCKNLPVILIPIAGLSIFLISFSQDWGIAGRVLCGLICLACFALTLVIRGNLIKRPLDSLSHTQKDLRDLLTNTPWLILLVVGVLFCIFTGVRPTTATFYFTYYLDREDLVGTYFAITLIASLAAALVTSQLTRYIAKRTLFIASLLLGALFSSAIYIIEPGQTTLMLVLAAIGEFFAGIMPVLFFSMLGDSADYSEWVNRRRATGLVYSAGTFSTKTGYGFAGALSMIVLAMYGYNSEFQATITGAFEGMKLLMSFIPAIICVLAAGVLLLYPLTDAKMQQIESDLKERRSSGE